MLAGYRLMKSGGFSVQASVSALVYSLLTADPPPAENLKT
jgi:hypothetical protein